MSMNWTQYLLSKLAEEAGEVAKEALKCQQHGVNSQYKNKPAIMELRKELFEVIAVLEALEERNDVSEALGVYNLGVLPAECQDDDVWDIKSDKMDRLFYYAIKDYKAGTVSLSFAEHEMVLKGATQYSVKYSLPM